MARGPRGGNQVPADPAAARNARETQATPVRVYLPVLDADPEKPGQGECWLRRNPPGGVYDLALRAQIDDQIFEAGLDVVP